jgi:hypothetical protein
VLLKMLRRSLPPQVSAALPEHAMLQPVCPSAESVAIVFAQ